MFKNFKLYLKISIVSIFFSIYSFEGYLIYKNLNEKNFNYKKKLFYENQKKKYDERSISQYYNYLKKNSDKKVTVAFYPNYFLRENINFQPLSGLSNTLTINCNENGYYSTYMSDRYGFNNPDEVWESNEIEYMLVGDSFTHGACVNRPYDIGSVLRKLTKTDVLNLGYGHNGPLLEFATLKEFLNKKPKKILWLYFEGNDLSDLNFELENEILNNYLLDENFSQNIILKQNQVDKLIENRILDLDNYRNDLSRKENLKYKILKFIRLDKTKRILSHKNEILQKEKLLEIIKKANDLSIKNGSKFFFVYLPSYERYNKFVNQKNYKDYFFIISTLRNLKIPIIDIHSDVISKNPKSFFPFGLTGHYNEKGYLEVSKYIKQFTIN